MESPQSSVVSTVSTIRALRVAHDLLAVAAPHSAHLGEKPFRVFEVVELQVDHHVVRILDRPHDVIATNPRPFAVGRVTVEGPLPAGEVRDCVFDSQNWHSWLL